MAQEVEIRMTRRGFEVTVGGHTSAFGTMRDAFAFAQRSLERACRVRELSDRCE